MNLLARSLKTVAGLFSKAQPSGLSAVGGGHGWFTIFDNAQPPGAFQTDIHVHHNAVLANWTVFACMTLIASDIAKLRFGLVQKNDDGTWTDTESPAFSPVLKKPNGYQTSQQFREQWVLSKLEHGNTYVLNATDNRNTVVAQYVLDPRRVTPLVALDGSVYYQLGEDNLAQISEFAVAVPASEIIHDRMNCLFHPLVGLSPIFASGLAAMQGLRIQQNSAKFFQNMSRPSGILTAPKQISDETAKRLKDNWEANYSNGNVGKIAVLGDDLKYMPMTQNAVDSQMVEQLKLSAEMICSTFHVPAFKIGAGTIPAGQKVGDLNQIYYADCLQALMKAIEDLQDLGLGLTERKGGTQYGTSFVLDDLLMMDSATLTNVLKEQVSSGMLKLDEGRARLNYGPMKGGNAAFLQQQNFSVEALAKRDAQADPFGMSAPPAPAPAETVAPAPAPEPAKNYDAEFLSQRELINDFKATFEAEMFARAEAEERRLAEIQQQEDANKQAHVFAEALISKFASAQHAA